MSADSSEASISKSNEPLRVGVAGLGRMGMIHALHIHELARETDLCRLTAVATQDKKAAEAFLKMTGGETPVFEDIREFAKPGLCDVTVIATNTPLHRTHATMMIEAGQRVFLEKPLTGMLEGDRAFAEVLEREHPRALMLGFQRRFDEPTCYAKQLIDEGAIGRVYKIYSALEDSGPAPDGFCEPWNSRGHGRAQRGRGGVVLGAQAGEGAGDWVAGFQSPVDDVR